MIHDRYIIAVFKPVAVQHCLPYLLWFCHQCNQNLSRVEWNLTLLGRSLILLNSCASDKHSNTCSTPVVHLHCVHCSATLQCIRAMDCEYALCSLFAPGDRHVIIGTKVRHYCLVIFLFVRIHIPHNLATVQFNVPSVLWHCWLGHLTRKNSSPIWSIMCLVGR